MRLEVNNVETYLTKQVQLGNLKWRLTEKAETPMQTFYRTEIDISPDLDPIEYTYSQSFIGMT